MSLIKPRNPNWPKSRQTTLSMSESKQFAICNFVLLFFFFVRDSKISKQFAICNLQFAICNLQIFSIFFMLFLQINLLLVVFSIYLFMLFLWNAVSAPL